MFGLFRKKRDPNEALVWYRVFFNFSGIMGGALVAAAAVNRAKELAEKMRRDYEKEGKQTTPLVCTVGSVFFEVQDYPSDVAFMLRSRSFTSAKWAFKKAGCDLTIERKGVEGVETKEQAA